ELAFTPRVDVPDSVYSLSSLGDFDGDGIGDLILGDSHSSVVDYDPDFGSIYLFSHQLWAVFLEADGTPRLTTPLLGRGSFGYEGDDRLFGRSVEVLGDIDGDGIADLTVGEPGADSVTTCLMNPIPAPFGNEVKSSRRIPELQQLTELAFGSS